MHLLEEGFCLENLMGLESMGAAQLLCGQGALSREVSRINVVEDSNLTLWSAPGDAVLSSGYPFWRNAKPLLEALPRLQNTGVAALALKPERDSHRIPEAVKDMAAELAFPLIQLPPTAVFANIVYEGRDLILRRREAFLHRVQRQSQQLLEQLLRAASPVEALEAVERAMGGNPVIACSTDNDLIVSPATSALLYDNFEGDFISRLHSKRGARDTVNLVLGHKRQQVNVHLFRFEGHKGCSLFVLECRRTLTDSEVEVLGRSMPMLAMEINNAVALKKVRRKYKDRFIRNLILGKLGGPADICAVAQAQGYQMSPQCRYRVVVIAPKKERAGGFSEEELGILHLFTRALETMAAFTLYDRQLVLVYEDGAPGADFPLLADLDRYIRKTLHKHKMCFYISEPCGLEDIPEAYAEASRIRAIGQRCGCAELFTTYDKLGVLALLSLLPDNKVVKRYRESLLAPLVQYDSRHNTNLKHTLEVYLDSGCNGKLTAERLYTHYNTVSYRIERIREIGGYDLDDPEQILQLQIAFKMAFLEVGEKGDL